MQRQKDDRLPSARIKTFRRNKQQIFQSGVIEQRHLWKHIVLVRALTELHISSVIWGKPCFSHLKMRIIIPSSCSVVILKKANNMGKYLQ